MITGGLRSWLLTRGESIIPGSSLTALVPMSVTEDDGEPTSLGSQVAPHLQRLPIGEPNPLMRLHQVAYDTQAHKDSGRAVGARSLADIAGFAPTTLHALGVRTSTEVVRKQHDLVITNVPGPQVPLYAAGAQLVASYPVLPLSAGHLLAIGVTSYDGEVFFGLTVRPGRHQRPRRARPMPARCARRALGHNRPSDECASAHSQGDRSGPPRRCEEGSSAAGGSA